MADLIRRHLVRLIESDNSAYPQVWNEDYEKGFCDAINRVLDLPSAQPELIKDTIQKFHDYQVEWLTSHCDLEFEPMLESWVVRFLHDTANCYMMEVEHDN